MIRLHQVVLWRTCLLLASVTLAAAVDCSTSRFNFFPANKVNIPGAWTKANQTKAGNECDGYLLPIAVQGIPKPLLHFTPIHNLLVLGGEVPDKHIPPQSQLEPVTKGQTSAPGAADADQLDLGKMTTRGGLVTEPVHQTRQQLQQQQQRPPEVEQDLEPSMQQTQPGIEHGPYPDTFEQLNYDVDEQHELHQQSQESGAVSHFKQLQQQEQQQIQNSDVLPNYQQLQQQLTAQQQAEADQVMRTLLYTYDVTATEINDFNHTSTATRDTRNQFVEHQLSSKPSVVARNLSHRARAVAKPINTSSRLRLAKAAGKLMVGQADVWTVAVPAQFVFSVRVNGKMWFKSKVFKGYAEVPEVNFNANITEGRRDVFDPVIFQEGINTVVIDVTVLNNSGVITNGYNMSMAPARDETFSSPPIDFYFFMRSNETHDSRPSAQVKLHSCSPELSFQMNNTSPPPVLVDGYRLTYRPSSTTQAFFLPVYYLYGSYLEGLDGTTDMTTDNTEGNVKNFGVYITRLPGSPSAFNVTVPQLSFLREGWYSLTVEGAIWSPNTMYDNLMSVAGIDKFGNKLADYLTVTPGGNITDAISLYGGFKGAGWVLPEYNKTRIGIQRRQTWLNYFNGPETAITLGQRATFSWEFDGLGNATCRINGVDPGVCTSPLAYPIVTTLNQTLTLAYTDVCDAVYNFTMTFGTFGWEVQGAGVAHALGSSGVYGMSDRGELAMRRSSTSAAGVLWRHSWRQSLVMGIAVCMLLLVL